MLLGQAGDECRGSCGIRLLRRALEQAGYPGVALLSLNVRDIDRDTGLPITPRMVRQALAAAVWGDTLALLRNQVRPYEASPGAAEALWRRWMERLGADLEAGRNLSRRRILDRCRELIASFRAVETVPRRAQRVPSWERSTRNTAAWATGTWRRTWPPSPARSAWAASPGTPSTTWTPTPSGAPAPQRAVYRALAGYLAEIQREMLDLLREAGFRALPPFAALKRNAAGYAPLRVTVADGWLIAAEAAAWAALGYRKILCVQPFACLPGHIFGKGQYAALQRKLPDAPAGERGLRRLHRPRHRGEPGADAAGRGAGGDAMKRTLLIPALLDHHWPLLRWAFESDAWHAVVLDDREGVEDLALRRFHGDLCYPFHLIAGQVLSALRSGRYNPARAGVLIAQAGDGCRGSCLIRCCGRCWTGRGSAPCRC